MTTNIDRIVFFCTCGTSALVVERDVYDELRDISISMWEPRLKYNWVDWPRRLQGAWRMLRYGRAYEDDIILTREDARRLGENLVEWSKEESWEYEP